MPGLPPHHSEIKGRSLPPKASSPSTTQIGSTVYILGGRANQVTPFQGEDQKIPKAGCDSQLRWLDLDAEELEWKRSQRPLGSNPGPLYGHTLSAYRLGDRDYLIATGGVNLAGRSEHQISIWDVEQERWLDLSSMSNDSEVEQEGMQSGFLAERQPDSIAFDLNGEEEMQSDEVDFHQEISLESLEDEIDDQITQDHIHSRQALIEEKFSSFSPRFLHTATVVYSSDPYLFVVGGYFKTSSFTNVLGSFQILNLATLKWSPIFKIPQRYSHSSVLLDGNLPNQIPNSCPGQQILLFGGRDELGSSVSPEDSLLLNAEEALNRWRCWEEGRDDLVSSEVATAFTSAEDVENGLNKLAMRRNDGLWERFTLFRASSSSDEVRDEESECPASKGRAEIKVMGGRLVLFGESFCSSISSIQMQAFVFDLQTGIWTSLAEVLPESCFNRYGILASSRSRRNELTVISFGNGRDSDSAFYLNETHLDDALGFRSCKPTSKTNLSKDLASLLYDQETQLFPPPDFSFVSSFGNHPPIRAHKLVLLARWPHLKAILDSGMKESQDNQLVFHLESAEAIKSFIHYLYTDELPASFSAPIDKREARHEIYHPVSPSVEDDSGEKQWRTALSLMSLSSIYLIPRLFQLSSKLLKRCFLSLLNAGRVYSASLKLIPAESTSQFSRSEYHDSSRDEMSRLTREWVQELSEFCQTRSMAILRLAKERKSRLDLLARGDDSYYSQDDVDLAKKVIEEEIDILLIGLGQGRGQIDSYDPISTDLPRIQFHSPDQACSKSLSMDSDYASMTRGNEKDEKSPLEENRNLDYQRLLTQVTARLANVKQTSPWSLNRKSSSNERGGSPNYSGHRSPASSFQTSSHRTAPRSSCSPTSRVTISLADVSSGRVTPCNRLGRVVLNENLAVDHYPETM